MGKVTVKDIVEQHLKDKGFDGLCNADAGCGCQSGDLMPCDDPCGDCEIGVMVKKGTTACLNRIADCEESDGCQGWCIVPKEER